MMNGFTFKNRHSSEFGIVLKTKSAVIFPSPRLYSYSPMHYDGSYDFSECNPYERTFYNDRMFELQMQIMADNFTLLQSKAAKIAAWLVGSGELVFDAANSTRWRARVSSQLSFSPEHRGKKAVIGVIFVVSAMGQASFDVSEGIKLSDGLLIGSGILLEVESKFLDIKLSAGNNTVSFLNIGDFYIRPIFTISGNCDMVTLGSMGKSFSVSSIGKQGVVIDFEKHTVTSKTGENLMGGFDGEFFEFPAGRTDVNIYSDADAVADISYYPKTMYDFNFNGIDWEG